MIKQYKKNTHLFFEREDVKYICFLVQGRAALYKLTNQQEKKVVFICGAGEALNEIVLQSSEEAIKCEFLSDSVVLMFPIITFLSVMHHDFNLTIAIMRSLTIKVCRLYWQMKNTNASLHLDKKITAKLWKLSLDHGIEHELGR